MGIKVTLRRIFAEDRVVVARTFVTANEWNFSDVGTLVLMDNREEEGKLIIEFPVDIVGSVEFV